MWTGLLFAVLATVLNSAAGLLQAAATCRSAAGTALLGDRRYLAGLGVDGLVLVASGADAAAPEPVTHFAEIILGVAAGALVVCVAGLRTSRHDATLAVLAGLGFGGTSIAVRAIHPAGLLQLLAQPAVYLVLCFWLAGLVAYTRAIAIGSLPLVTAVYLVTEVIVPGLASMLLLGDTVRSGWAVPMALGLALAAGGVLVLSNSPAHRT